MDIGYKEITRYATAGAKIECEVSEKQRQFPKKLPDARSVPKDMVPLLRNRIPVASARLKYEP